VGHPHTHIKLDDYLRQQFLLHNPAILSFVFAGGIVATTAETTRVCVLPVMATLFWWRKKPFTMYLDQSVSGKPSTVNPLCHPDGWSMERSLPRINNTF